MVGSEESLECAEKIKLDGKQLLNADSDLPIKEADAEFTGVLRLTPESLETAESLWTSRTLSQDANISDLLRALNAISTDIETVDIGGRWAELETARDLSRFVLDTKANTLRRLESMVAESTILEQYTFTADN